MKRFLTLLFILVTLTLTTKAGPGDTTIVQTFTYGSPQNAKFLFPPDTVQFEKVLLYYTLKCNPAQSPACGEWDYLTYTRLYDHTGVFDSIMQSHAWYMLDMATPDTIRLLNSPGYQYDASFETYIDYTDTLSFSTYSIGSGTVTQSGFPGSGQPGGRSVSLYKASELTTAGLTAGNLTGLRLNFNIAGNTFERPVMRLAQTTLDSLTPEIIASLNFTTVYELGGTLPASGFLPFAFFQNFSWDGISNLVLDISYESHSGNPVQIACDPVAAGISLFSDAPDYMLEFDGADAIDLDPAPFVALNQEVTLAFWRYGDPDKQPQANSTIFASDSLGNRVLNIHLPWSNGSVYWDAGNTGTTYDRINKTATVPEYEGKWNHWAFTKNASTGTMKIYLNGQLWHSGTGKTMSMTGITEFRFGGMNNPTADRFDDAMLDEFGAWDKELSATQIQALMYAKPDTSDASYGNLLAYFGFDEGSGTHVADMSGQSNGAELFGMPQWLAHDEALRFKDFRDAGLRPAIVFERGTFISSLDSTLVIDSVETGMVSVISFLDPMNPTVASDTINAWLTYPIIGFDINGLPIDSNWADADTMLINGLSYYYDPPFEIVDRYELMRFITPYGNGLDLGGGWTWIYDITDFSTLLHDSVHLSAGNWQELLDMKVVMIEGTPPRDVLKVENVWTGNYNLSSFDVAVPPKWINLDPGASMWRLKSCITGHQFSNATNCAEFCPKIQSIDVNDTTRYSWQIIQECADNPLHPQGGTWIYDRAGWCPGMEGRVYDHEITPFVYTDSVKLDYNSQSDPYGNYVTEVVLVSYGEPNFQLDAAVSAIIAPNDWELRSRVNPICGSPRIEIKNAGALPLTDLDISYRFAGDTFYHYHWSGNLAFLGTETVALPPMDFRSPFAQSGKFEVVLSNPNGGSDAYSYNDRMQSAFSLAPVYDRPIIVEFRTNWYPQENAWFVYDDEGNTVYSRTSFSANSIHRDTVLLPPGCYEFVMYDSDDDGISWWANNDGNGILRFWALYGTVVKNFEPDFGKETRFQFSYSESIGIDEVADDLPELLISPNPGNGDLMAAINGAGIADLDISVFDLTGRIAWTAHYPAVSNENIRVDLSTLPQGSYRMMTTHGEKRFMNQVVIIR